MDLQEIVQKIRASRSLPDDDDLRRLPFKGAFIYGRVSSQGQVKESEESIREIAKLVMLAKKDGYQTGLDLAAVEGWLESIQAGKNVSRTMEDGDVIINLGNLGLSGTLGEDRRPGLADLWRRVEGGEVGCIYLTEGMSRLSRDRDRVLGYQLLKLLKAKRCRIRTPEEVYNPAIPRDWSQLAEDVEDSAEELKKLGIRLGRRRAAKAADGEHVGSPVCPGYIVGIEGQKHDGSFIFGRWQLYPPHQKIVIEALEELVKQGSFLKAVRALRVKHVVFPFFPEELRYMRTRSTLRFFLKDNAGYLITRSALMGLATNLRLIGVWQWRDIVIENNHPPAVPIDLFERAYEIARSVKPKGRAAYNEPMEWAGIIYCCNHDEPRRLTAQNGVRRWSCRPSLQLGYGESCLQIADRFLTAPLTREALDYLDLAPHAQAVLEKLKSEAGRQSLDENQRRKREVEIKARIASLQQYLGSPYPEREVTYWRLINEEREKLELLKKTPVTAKTTSMDIEEVARFLENIDKEWESLPSRLRNWLLTLLIDRVELHHDGRQIDATIFWKAGLRQAISIKRPERTLLRERLWQPEEDKLLQMLWPSSSHQAILSAFPGRTWHALNGRASSLGLKRREGRTPFVTLRAWSKEEERLLKELYPGETDIKEISGRLGRSEMAIIQRAHELGVRRPPGYRHLRQRPSWDAANVDVMQASSLPFRRTLSRS